MPKSRPLVAGIFSALLLFASILPVAAAAAAAPAVAPSGAPSAPAACSQLIKNGNFDATPVGMNWTQEGGNGLQLIDDFNPRTKPYSADLGGKVLVTHSVKQQFTVPANTILNVSFWWEQWTQETAPSTNDYLAVNLLDSNGALLAQLAKLGVDPDRPPWQEPNPPLNLSGYGGKTVQLQFQAVNDALLPTQFFVDDVSATACTAKQTYLPLIWR